MILMSGSLACLKVIAFIPGVILIMKKSLLAHAYEIRLNQRSLSKSLVSLIFKILLFLESARRSLIYTVFCSCDELAEYL